MICVAFAAAILLWAVLGVAAEFPVKPLRMVVPGEKRQARWLRELVGISVKSAP